MNEHRWLDDVPAFVLGTLEDPERAAFEAHLEQCARCRDAVREHQAVTGELAAAVPSLTPPPALKARVLEAAFAGESSRAAPSAAEPSAGAPAGEAGESTLLPSAAWAPWLAAAAGAAFAIWAGVANQRSADRADRLAAEVASARATIDTLRVEGARRDSMLAALGGPAVETATLTSTGSEPRVRLFWNRATEQLLVTAFELPPPPTGRTYQLWGLAPDAAPASLGTFHTGPDGRALALHRLAAGASYAQSAVTEEPAGGSPQPTTQPFLVGPWSASTQ